jgi:putative transposase
MRYGVAERESIAAKLRGSPEEAQRIRKRFLDRMYDLSVFQKELKGQFAQWYNRLHKRVGHLWSERFKSVIVEKGQALAAVSAYIDLNPVRAGICEDPKDFCPCGYHEAMVKRNPKRREGMRTALGLEAGTSWEEVSSQYRKLLFQTGIRPADAHRGGFTEEAVERVVENEKGHLNEPELLENEKGHLSEPELLRCTMPSFQGKILGTKEYVEGLFKRFGAKLHYKRPPLAQRIEEMKWAEIWVFGQPRSGPSGRPRHGPSG